MAAIQKDLIIIGGGLSGLAAGIVASAKGLDTLLIERGESAGSQSPLDELAYPHSLKTVLGDFSRFGSILTPIERRAFWITTPDGHTALECVKAPDETGLSGFVADRPELDFALAERMRILGGEILTRVEVRSLLRNESGSIGGVVCGDDEIEYSAPLTIIADGSSSPFADHLLARQPLLDSDYLFIAKEIFTGDGISVSTKLTGNESGAASIILLGDPLGIGFSWARIIGWKDKLILKIYLPLDLMDQETGVSPLMESFKMHPSVEPILRNLRRTQFLTGIVPVAGFEKHSDLLWGDGFLVAGKAARLYHPFDCRMTDYSIVSGVQAGQAAVSAQLERRPDHPSHYPRLLEDTFLMPDRDSMSNFMNFMRNKKEFASAYPEMFMLLVDGIFTMDNRRKRDKKRDIERELRKLASPWDLSKDFISLFKNYG